MKETDITYRKIIGALANQGIEALRERDRHACTSLDEFVSIISQQPIAIVELISKEEHDYHSSGDLGWGVSISTLVTYKYKTIYSGKTRRQKTIVYEKMHESVSANISKEQRDKYRLKCLRTTNSYAYQLGKVLPGIPVFLSSAEEETYALSEAYLQGNSTFDDQ